MEMDLDVVMEMEILVMEMDILVMMVITAPDLLEWKWTH